MAKYVFVYDLDTLSHGHTCAVQEKAKNTPEISCALALCHNTDGSTTTMQANSPWDSMLHRPRNGFFFFFFFTAIKHLCTILQGYSRLVTWDEISNSNTILSAEYISLLKK